MTREMILRIAKLLAILLGGVLVLYLASLAVEVTVAAIIAGLLYYLSLPVTGFLERHKVPRLAAVIVTLASIATVIAVLLIYLVPIVIEQLTALAAEAPRIIERVEAWFDRLRERAGRGIGQEQFDNLVDQAGNAASNYLGAAAAGILGTLANVLGILLAVLIGIITAFYLLKDHDRIGEYMLKYVPERSEPLAITLSEGVNRVLSGFLRGQIIVASIIGTLAGIALLILGVPFTLLLAVVSALFEFIPYLGPILATVPAVLLGLSVSPTTALLVLVVFLTIQQIESLILSPRIIGAQIRLHPITVIFAVMIGARVMGVLGVFLAIPLAGIAKILAEQFTLTPPERREAQEFEDQH